MAFLAEKVAALEARAAKLEATAPCGGTVNSPGLILKLEELMKVIDEDRKEAEAIRAQRDELQTENENLKSQVDKLNYRCRHLIRALEAAETKR